VDLLALRLEETAGLAAVPMPRPRLALVPAVKEIAAAQPTRFRAAVGVANLLLVAQAQGAQVRELAVPVAPVPHGMGQRMPVAAVATHKGPRLAPLEVLAAAVKVEMTASREQTAPQILAAAVPLAPMAAAALATAARVSSSFGTRSKGTALWPTSHKLIRTGPSCK